MVLAAMQAQPDYVALAMMLAAVLFAAGAALRKRFLTPRRKRTERPASPPAPGSAGRLKLNNVEPKVAAMLMAIVAYETGMPLNKLRFLSVREVTEP